MKNNLIILRAATQLYGAIPEDKIFGIYNMQNEDMITVNDLTGISMWKTNSLNA